MHESVCVGEPKPDRETPYHAPPPPLGRAASHRRARPRPALALAVIATLPLTRPAAEPRQQETAGLTPVSVSYGLHGSSVKGQFLSYNDFHGALDPPAGSSATVNGTPAGGGEFLATWLKRLRA